MPDDFALRPTGWEPPNTAPAAFPDPTVVHTLHDRYLLEVVEGMGLCPFARKSREDGRVHRLLLAAAGERPSPTDAATALARCVARHRDAEIVLLTFVPERDHPFWDPRAFESFTRKTRATYSDLGRRGFYMVSFHPFPPDPGRAATPENLVPQIRRTPDPVIQCVQAELLDRVRAQAQEQARRRLHDEIARLEPEVRALLAGSVSTDPELSSEIARHNFGAAGSGPGRARLDTLLDDLLATRAHLYPAAVQAPSPT